MTPEDTWGCSTLHSCLPTSKTHQREIQSADCLLIGNIGFTCSASGWALLPKADKTAMTQGWEPALEQQVALEIYRPEEKGWRQWWRTSGRAVRSKKTGTMKLVLGEWSVPHTMTPCSLTDVQTLSHSPMPHFVPSLPSPQQLSKPVSSSSCAQT